MIIIAIPSPILFITLVCLSLGVQSQMPTLEKEAMMDFVTSMPILATWHQWNSTNNPCLNWRGVTCSGDGNHVVNITLPSSNSGQPTITGTIPNSIESLAFLQVFDAAYHNITGTVPASMGNLLLLRYLRLANLKLVGTLPASFEKLSQLEYLNIDSNELSGPIPEWLGNISNLTHLSVLDNKFNGTLPSSIGKLSKLQLLHFGSNLLSGTIPDSYGNLSSLTIFNGWINNLTGSIPESIGQLSNLFGLSLSQNTLSGPIPSSFGNLKKLSSLSLSDNKLNGSIPASIGLASSIVDLQLDRNELSGPIPTSINNLNNLAIIGLSNNQFTGCLQYTARNPFIYRFQNNYICCQHEDNVPLTLQSQSCSALLSLHVPGGSYIKLHRDYFEQLTVEKEGIIEVNRTTTVSCLSLNGSVVIDLSAITTSITLDSYPIFRYRCNLTNLDAIPLSIKTAPHCHASFSASITDNEALANILLTCQSSPQSTTTPFPSESPTPAIIPSDDITVNTPLDSTELALAVAIPLVVAFCLALGLAIGFGLKRKRKRNKQEIELQH